MQLFKIVLLFIFLANGTSGMAQKRANSSVLTSVSYNKKTDTTHFTMIPRGSVAMKGDWKQGHYDATGRQYFFTRADSTYTTLAIARNPKKNYPFFKAQKTSYELVSDFYKWDSNFRVEKGYQQTLIKADSVNAYIIWRVFDNQKTDNFFIFGTRGDLLTNYLMSSQRLDLNQIVSFLEDLYLKN